MERTARQPDSAVGTPDSGTASCSGLAAGRPWQFSLRTMFAFTCMAAVFSLTLVPGPLQNVALVGTLLFLASVAIGLVLSSPFLVFLALAKVLVWIGDREHQHRTERPCSKVA